MQINWKVRWRNPTWLAAFLALIVSTAYRALAMFDIVPVVPEDAVTRVLSVVVRLLTLLGVLIDPTTRGVGDSARALEYEAPN